MSTCSACIYVYMYITCIFTYAYALLSAYLVLLIKEHQIPLKPEPRAVVNQHVGCWDLNLGPLHKQLMLLTAQPSSALDGIFISTYKALKVQ